MKISEILKEQGLFSNDIKNRIKNKQITINGETISSDIDINCIKIIDGCDFVFNMCKNKNWLDKLKMFGIENLFESNIDNDLTMFLKNFIWIKISKKQFLIAIKNTEILS